VNIILAGVVFTIGAHLNCFTSTWSEATPLNVYRYTLWNGLKPVPAKSVEATPLRLVCVLTWTRLKASSIVADILSTSPAPMFLTCFMFSNGTCSIRKCGSEGSRCCEVISANVNALCMVLFFLLLYTLSEVQRRRECVRRRWIWV
jgi:hypothetical protein